MNRHNKVKEILEHAKEINTNLATIVFLLATLNDKQLTKFYKGFLSKVSNDTPKDNMTNELK
jgi:hypothetical protein